MFQQNVCLAEIRPTFWSARERSIVKKSLRFSLFFHFASDIFDPFWSKNPRRCSGGRQAPSPNGLFSTVWGATPAQVIFSFFFNLFAFVHQWPRYQNFAPPE